MNFDFLKDERLTEKQNVDIIALTSRVYQSQVLLVLGGPLPEAKAELPVTTEESVSELMDSKEKTKTKIISFKNCRRCQLNVLCKFFEAFEMNPTLVCMIFIGDCMREEYTLKEKKRKKARPASTSPSMPAPLI